MFGEDHLRHLFNSCTTTAGKTHCHQGLSNVPRAVASGDESDVIPFPAGRVECRERLGGAVGAAEAVIGPGERDAFAACVRVEIACGGAGGQVQSEAEVARTAIRHALEERGYSPVPEEVNTPTDFLVSVSNPSGHANGIRRREWNWPRPAPRRRSPADFRGTA